MPRTFLSLLVAVVVCRVPPGALGQEKGSDVFKSGKVLTLHLEIGPKEMDALRREPRKYVKATLKEGDKSYPGVGVHLKGAAGSFRNIDDKASLTINMDKFAEGQRFHGLDKFHLANSLQDPSYCAELICGEMFRAAGVPASRVAHAVVFINGKRRGLYYVKEGYDGYFLKAHFNTRKGNFYDGGFLRDIDQPLQVLRSKDDVKDQADLKALLAAAREPDRKVRFDKLEKLLDLDRFISFLALEVITWDWDGYPMNRNNYRVYHDPTRNKIVFIPSGMDQMFGDPNGPILPNFNGFVARSLMETPEGRKRYLTRLGELHRTVLQPEAQAKRLEELQKELQPVLAAFDKEGARQLPGQINALRDRIRQRYKSVEEQLKRVK